MSRTCTRETIQIPMPTTKEYLVYSQGQRKRGRAYVAAGPAQAAAAFARHTIETPSWDKAFGDEDVEDSQHIIVIVEEPGASGAWEFFVDFEVHMSIAPKCRVVDFDPAANDRS